ncbi:MAG: hypothetical protein N2D54_02850 [Chloroflexota bacterium]
MLNLFSNLLDRLSEYLAPRKGLLPLLGIMLIIINFALQFFPGLGFLQESDMFLHLGVIVSVFGLLLARAL